MNNPKEYQIASWINFDEKFKYVQIVYERFPIEAALEELRKQEAALEELRKQEAALEELRRILTKTSFEEVAECIYNMLTVLANGEIHKGSLLQAYKRRLNLCKALLILKTSKDITIKGENDTIKLDSLWKQRIQSELERAFGIREEVRTIEHIRDCIRQLEENIKENTKSEGGAPVKNLKAIIAVDFFQSWKQFEYKQKLNNQDCRTIFEVLNFFGLIDEGLIECWGASAKKSYPEIQYVKSLIRQAGNYIIEWKDEKEIGNATSYDDYYFDKYGNIKDAEEELRMLGHGHGYFDPYDLYMNK